MATVRTVDPVLETASDHGRAIAGGDGLLPVQRPPGESPRHRLPFATRFQGLLIVVMVIGIILIAQQGTKNLYQIGLPVLIVAAFFQIAFGNIPPRSGFRTSILLLALTWLIVAGLVALSVWLAPTLINLGRGGGE